jgi:hypothetical protein
MAQALPRYNVKDCEAKWRKVWEEASCFAVTAAP